MYIPEPNFIAKLFSKYLYYKEKYMFNYISDKSVKTYTEELSRITEKEQYNTWVDEKLESTEEIEKYKIVFSTLLDCDKRVAADPVKISGYNNNLALDDCLVLAIGKKRWNETKLTVGSCPFQNIRGIVLNSKERETFEKVLNALSEVALFTDGELKVAASHANKCSGLKIKAEDKLSFGNIGISVSAKCDDAQKTVIEKSIIHAAKNNAKILIFPELSINESMLGTLESALDSHGKDLKLVVGGSYYYKSKDNAFANTAPIYVNTECGWKRIADYAKMIPFSMSYTEKAARALGINTQDYPPGEYNLLTEYISMDDNITLLPYKDCVIGVAICRDVMDLLNSHNPLHKYCDFVDIMLVISENRGDSNMFVGTAECLARWHNCATVYTNSIGSSPTPDSNLEISFAIYPYKGTNVSSSTAVSGDITYEKKPFNARRANDEDMVGILNSPGIEYTQFTEEELANCCKVYTVKETKQA